MKKKILGEERKDGRVKMEADVHEMNRNGVAGPKKLGCFGASYLYPIFLEIGVISLPKRKGDCFGE